MLDLTAQPMAKSAASEKVSCAYIMITSLAMFTKGSCADIIIMSLAMFTRANICRKTDYHTLLF